MKLGKNRRFSNTCQLFSFLAIFFYFFFILLPQHYTCWILLDFYLHLVYFIMQNNSYKRVRWGWLAWPSHTAQGKICPRTHIRYVLTKLKFFVLYRSEYSSLFGQQLGQQEGEQWDAGLGVQHNLPVEILVQLRAIKGGVARFSIFWP